MRTRIKDLVAKARVISLDVSRHLLNRVSKVAEATRVRNRIAHDLRHAALICGGDSIAADYLLHGREFGVRAPVDFSGFGFDTNSLGEELASRLTTVLQPFQLKGKSAVNILVRCIDCVVDIPSLFIQCSLETGDSTLSIANKEIIS